MPRHTFGQPVPVVVRIVWEHDGEEHIDTVALGWTGQHAYIRLPDRGTASPPCGWTPAT
jgi:hypothetical protein